MVPEGINTAVTVDCAGQTTLTVSTTVNHLEKITALGDYVLPMRAVYYDEKGGKHNLLGGEVLIPVSVMDIYMAVSPSAPTGTVMSVNSNNVTLDPKPSYGNTSRLFDGKESSTLYLKGNTTVIIDLGQKEKISGVQLASGSYTASYPASVAFYSSDDKSSWKELSGVCPWGQTQWMSFNVLKNVSARYLKIEITAANLKMLSEIKIYK